MGAADGDGTRPAAPVTYAEVPRWTPERPRYRLVRVVVAWLVAAVAVLVAGACVPGVTVGTFGEALVAAAIIAVLNAVLPPIIAALRLPFTLALGFLLVLLLDAAILQLASLIDPHSFHVSNFGSALLAAIVIAATSVVLTAILGVDDDDVYTLRVVQRIGRRQGGATRTAVPGIIFLEIDGLALPVLQRAMRDGSAPEMARWLEEGTHRLIEWEPDLSSQTGASQAGILLGSNEDIPAFRWVEKETGTLMTCSSPSDCAEIEKRHSSGRGLLADGGASRGNLFSGDAEEMILTVSRMDVEKRANPGYRAFLANGFNVTRELVLFFWEVVLERVAALQQRRRDIRPRGHRGGRYPLLRAALCVGVRDLIVFGVLTDMFRGRPAVYATFSSYDEVAHHSGLERADTLEALRKLDVQFGRIARARRYAPRPYELVVLSDHGQTQGATFLQRNGYTLEELVERSLEQGHVARVATGDENDAAAGHALTEATGRSGKDKKRAANDVSDRAGRRARLGQSRPHLPDGRRSAPPHGRGDRGATPPPAHRPARAPAHRLAARALAVRRSRRARTPRHALSRRRPGRGRGSALAVPGGRRRPPAPRRRLQPRRGHHGEQLLRRRARAGLRLRGADLLSRRARRPADASVPARTGHAARPERADRRRRPGP